MCSKDYKDDNLPRILTMCGHTYCENCILSMIKEVPASDSSSSSNEEEETQKKLRQKQYKIVCPDDNGSMYLKSADTSTFPKNIALIKVIEAKKNNLSFRDEDSSFNVSKIAKQDEIQEDEDAKDLITAIKEGETTR